MIPTANASSVNTARNIPDPTWPLAQSAMPNPASTRQPAARPTDSAFRAGDGGSARANQNMMPIPANSAALRRASTRAVGPVCRRQIEISNCGRTSQTAASRKHNADAATAQNLKLPRLGGVLDRGPEELEFVTYFTSLASVARSWANMARTMYRCATPTGTIYALPNQLCVLTEEVIDSVRSPVVTQVNTSR